MVIYGALGLPENDRSLVSSIGQNVVYDAANEFIRRHNEDLATAANIFIETTTEDHKDYYKLPGGGRLQRIRNMGRAAATRAGGQWDVAFPLEEFGAAFEIDRKSYAMLTVQQLANELATMRTQDVSTIRWEVLAALFNNADRSVIDEWPVSKGTLTIKPLANGDSIEYPPKIGADSDDFAADNHYLVSGYTSANISDDNNPYVTIREDIEEHFGTPTGYGNIVVFINTTEVAKTEALADFVEVTDIHINPGDDRDTVNGMPSIPSSARLLGRVSGVWVAEWRYIPSGYLLGVDADSPAPTRMRVHRAEYTLLQQGFALVAEDERHPIKTRNYEHDFGIGVANRLNGVAMQLKASGSYDVPSRYAR